MTLMFTILRTLGLGLILATPGSGAQSAARPQTPPAPVKATPQNAAAFIGEWDLSGQGSNGPASFALSLKPEGESLTAALTNGDGEPQTVNKVSVAGSNLSLNVTFYNAGNEYPSVLTLTPADDKILLHIEVADGLAQLDGTAKKKIQK
jgi:hypothetical protein